MRANLTNVTEDDWVLWNSFWFWRYEEANPNNIMVWQMANLGSHFLGRTLTPPVIPNNE